MSDGKATILDHMTLDTTDTMIRRTGIIMMKATELETATITNMHILPGKQKKIFAHTVEHLFIYKHKLYT